MRLFHRLILRPMRRERLRAVLTMLGVALGVAIMLAIQLANRASLSGFERALNAVSGKAALEIMAPPMGIDENRLPELAWLRRVGIATPVIEADVMVTAQRGREMLRVMGIDALRDPALRDYAVEQDAADGATASSTQERSAQPLQGMDLMRLLREPDTIVVTAAFAKRLGVAENERVKLWVGDQRRECVVSAILGREGEAGSALADQALGVMDIANAQVLLNRTGRVDRLEVRLHEGVRPDEAEAWVRERLPSGLTLQRPQRRTAAVEKMLEAFHFNLTMLSGIALVVGLFLIYNTVSVAVLTRRKEIGMLRTLGVTRGQVLRLFWGEAIFLGFAGALLGVPLAKLLAEGVTALTSTTVGTLYIATAAQVPALNWQHWATGFGIALPLSLLAAAMPAFEAMRVSAIEAIRGCRNTGSSANDGGLRQAALPIAFVVAGVIASQQPAVNGLPLWGYFTCVCAIAAMALVVAPTLNVSARWLRSLLGRFWGIEGRLAAAQIQASTHRLAVSVAALAVSLALTVAIAVMVGSFRATVIYWVDQTMSADLYVRPGTGGRSQAPPTLSPATLQVLAQHPAIAAFDAYRSMDLPFQDRIVKLGASDFDATATHGRLALKTGGDLRTVLRDARRKHQVLVSESFAMRFGVREGNPITLTTVHGPREFGIAAQFYDYSNDSGTISMDRSLFEEAFGQGQPTHVAIYLKPGSSPDQVREDMMDRLQDKAFVGIFTNAGLRTEVLRIFDSTFAITWALEIIAVIVAMAGVAATMLTLLIERREEIRLLRIAGADSGQVRRTVVIEAGIVGSVSQGIGLVVGMLLSLVLIHVINPQSFGWSMRLHAPWAFLAASTVLTVAATMLAGLYPAWRATQDRLQTITE